MKYNFDKLVDRSNTYAEKWYVPHELRNEPNAIPMWVADMDFEVCHEIIDALKKRLECPVFGYTTQKEELKELLSSWYSRRYNYEFSKDDVVLTTGVVYSLSAGIRIFSEKGDKVIIPTPNYHPFTDKTLLNKREPLFTKLKLVNGRYCIDFEDLESKIDDKCKVFILCNPHNPTGNIYTKEEIGQIAEFCEKHNLKIISDEIHADFVYGKKINPIINYNDYTRNNAIALVSVSKTFNLAGLKISGAIIKNPELRKEFYDECNCVGIKSINLFAYVAFEAAYTYGEEWLDQLLAYLDENRKYAYDYIVKEMPQVKAYMPDATYFLWLDFEKCGIPYDQIESVLLHEGKVFVTKGSDFGPDYERFVRLNLACPKYLVEKGLQQIKEVVDRYSQNGK